MPQVTITKRSRVQGKIVEPDKVITVSEELASELIRDEVAVPTKSERK